MDSIEVEIVNWNKHQPRKDIKNPRWFALDNRILEDAKLFGLSDAEWKALLYIFCQASQQNNAIVQINLEHAKRVCGVQKSAVISLTRTHPYVIRTRVYAPRTQSVRDTTLQTLQNTHNKHADPNGSVRLNFESIYEKYPRKEGRSRGLKLCETQIKTEEELRQLEQAVLRYCEHIKTESVGAKYIKHFSTFMGCWRDFLDPNFGVTSSGAREKTLLEILQEA